ncbi:MAG: MaoC family dehydratase N-terminal domain-containing protein [Betaproteobacteria bacterium]
MDADELQASLAHWRTWVGRTETREDLVTAAPLAGLAATLDRDEPEPSPGQEIPPLAHWLYFLPRARQSALGDDGHPRRGGFLPPVPLPRRMWAGGRLAFLQPLRVGEALARTSRIAAVDARHGRSGPLVFVTVRHEITGARGLALTEEHDIVYREAPQPGAPASPPQPAPADAHFARTIVPDDVLLFRYSALTFNGHRIHYDRRWCERAEGYPGLVVHGPLIATLLLDLLRRERPAARVRRFGFTAVRPTFDTHAFRVAGRDAGPEGLELWAQDHEGWLTMRARAQLA